LEWSGCETKQTAVLRTPQPNEADIANDAEDEPAALARRTGADGDAIH